MGLGKRLAETTPSKTNGTVSNKLNKQEVSFLLRFIAGSSFHGENLKVIYKIVEKLEKQLQDG